jgi:uncharacterized repeat protein (TIGR04138 family)
MKDDQFADAVAAIAATDNRYDREAYFFAQKALFHTVKALNKPMDGPGRHVTGQDLLEGMRSYALQEFGPLARTVLRTWGIQCTEDFGAIVFNLVDRGVWGRTPEDKKEDFANGYSFEEAFTFPFLPNHARRMAVTRGLHPTDDPNASASPTGDPT